MDQSNASVQCISAVTLATHDMAVAVRFYETLGFTLSYGGKDSAFTSFKVGRDYLNLVQRTGNWERIWWGRVIFHVGDVDAFHKKIIAQGVTPDTWPQDAPWGERYFHLTDPDGHELSIAMPIDSNAE